MVFHFEPRGFQPETGAFLIYMGRDKHENEDLIAWGLPTDVWFHVEDLSSAHVYLRLPEGLTLDEIPTETLEDCIQLVKVNSIQGCKKHSVRIVYTPWSNLQKTADMVVGAVGFHSLADVRHVNCSKTNEIVNRLNRTKKEVTVDLQAQREEYDAKIRAQKKAAVVQQKKEDKIKKDEQKRQAEMKSYSTLMQEENMISSKKLSEKYTNVDDYEDDFM